MFGSEGDLNSSMYWHYGEGWIMVYPTVPVFFGAREYIPHSAGLMESEEYWYISPYQHFLGVRKTEIHCAGLMGSDGY